MQASVRALEEMDYEVGSEDVEKLVVRSREREVSTSSIPKLGYRYQWTIKSAGGKLSISVSCEENSVMDEKKFEECGDEVPAAIADDQEQLHHKILVIAKDWGG
jgi:hypothetical protein